jgi:putative FmdB family regulatory protein
MPLLEYRCSRCTGLFERLVSRTDGADQAECPTCNQLTGKRVLSLFAQVRGSDGATTAMPSRAGGGGGGGGCCGGGGCGCG